MRRLDDLSNRLFTIGLAYDKLETKSSLSSHRRGTDDNCYKLRDRCSYSTRCPRRPVFPRDVCRHHTSVPNRSNRNFGTSSSLSNRFGAPSCTIMHGRIQRVNRRHSRDDGLRRYRANPVMFGDRRGVARCDLRRTWNLNGHRKQEVFDEQYSQSVGASCDSNVCWRRSLDNDVNRQSQCISYDSRYPVLRNYDHVNDRTYK